MEQKCRNDELAMNRDENLNSKFLLILACCTDEVFDWLSLSDLAALSATSEKLQELTVDYVHRKYPMNFIKVNEHVHTKEIHYRCEEKSLQPFRQNVRSLVVEPCVKSLEYLKSAQNTNLTSISFYDGHFVEGTSHAIAELVHNAEIVEFLCGSLSSEFYESILKYCSNIKQLLIKYDFNECEVNGEEDQWMFKTYPTLQYLHWSAASLPTSLQAFFQFNPQVRSFHIGIYTAALATKFLIQTKISIDQLDLELKTDIAEDESLETAELISNLNRLHTNNQFRSLMLAFIMSSQLLNREWAKLDYLHGAYISFPLGDDSIEALSALVHLKLLIISYATILSRSKAEILSKHLQELQEIYIEIGSVQVISPFLRLCRKLQKIYIYRLNKDNNEKLDESLERHRIFMLNKDRIRVLGACMSTVYLPDKEYIRIKGIIHQMNLSHIKFMRSESHVPTQPFAATMLRRDICEDFEKF